MSEPTQQQPTELETLRRTNGELVEKSAKRKQRIAELEAQLTEEQNKVAERDATIHNLTIETPFKKFAAQVSNAPELFMEQLAKLYKVELLDGKLALQTPDGKPVTTDGKPVPFEHQAMLKLLCDEAHPQAATFRAVMIASRASGAASPTRGFGSTAPKKTAVPQFGLR